MSCLMHYGTPRHSGRYPWGSGDHPFQSSRDFYNRVAKMRKDGMSEVDIARSFGMSTSELRAFKTIAKNEKLAADQAMATRLKDKGYSNVAIGERMGIPESTVRNLLKPSNQYKSAVSESIANKLKDSINSSEAGFIDIGSGVERNMGISRTSLMTSVEMLKAEGYNVHYVQANQPGGKKTSVMVLANPDLPYNYVNKNKSKIGGVACYSEDGGKTFHDIEPPVSINSKRIAIKYGDQGGKEKDGLIELRRGVDDISLGQAKYAQVRIKVDDTHYLKGMAIYSDDLPAGVDIRFNTNKKDTGNKLDAMKPLKDDPTNPFGATVRQKKYIGKDGKEHLSVLNIVNEEGDWSTWSKSLSSQLLSKQTPALAKKQLDLAYDLKKSEYNDIMAYTNPVIKKKLLESFADDCDAAAVNLKAAALPRQSTHVLIPFSNMKETEVYAPNYNNGEKVVLIRYPHGGIFEIPELTVNNKHKEAKSVLKNAKDAIGINHKVAEQLSGADFDGDTVLVIPNNNKYIINKSPLEKLKNFDPKESYPKYDGMKVMSEKLKQKKMGEISNLITDMTIQGADWDEIAAAVRHSMVVIDAVKHELNYKQSYIDNNIANLRLKYQGRTNAGASTLISRASSPARVPERKEGEYRKDPSTGKIKKVYFDPDTGEKLYTPTGRQMSLPVKDKNGNIIGWKKQPATSKTTPMAEAKNARELSSGTRIENIYADHANRLKALANQSRKDTLSIKIEKASPSAKKTYAKEVESLNSKLDLALRNAPFERKALLLADSIFEQKKQANPDMDADDAKKKRAQAITEARIRVGAKKQSIKIEPEEWVAIQNHAISSNKLYQILNNTDLDLVKKLATPKYSRGLSNSKISRAKQMLARGYTQAEVADALGVSVSTIFNALD